VQALALLLTCAAFLAASLIAAAAVAVLPWSGFGVIRILERTGFPDELGRQWIFVRMHDAVTVCLAQMVAHGQTVLPTCAIDSAAVSPRHRAALSSPGPSRNRLSRGGPADISDAGSGAVILGLTPSGSGTLGHPMADANPEAATSLQGCPAGEAVPGARGTRLLPVTRPSPYSRHSGAVAEVSQRGLAVDSGALDGRASSDGDNNGVTVLGGIGSAALGLLDSLRLAAAGAAAVRSGSSSVDSSLVSQQDVLPLAGRYQSLAGGASELRDPFM